MPELEGELAFRLDLEEPADQAVLVVSIKDSTLNYSSTDVLKPALKEILGSAIERGRKDVVVNLSHVGVVDSCGLSTLIALKKQVEGEGGRIALSGLNGMIERLFAVTRLDKAFTTYDTAEHAVEAFAPQD